MCAIRFDVVVEGGNVYVLAKDDVDDDDEARQRQADLLNTDECMFQCHGGRFGHSVCVQPKKFCAVSLPSFSPCWLSRVIWEPRS